MDLGILATDVVSNANTTLTGFAAIFALSIGVALAVSIMRKFVRTR
jgi:hypothetical protein